MESVTKSMWKLTLKSKSEPMESDRIEPAKDGKIIGY
jgi:hypothetical protein